jgi:hypothetical protein
MGLTHSRVCKLLSASNPMFDAIAAALTPNIGFRRWLFVLGRRPTTNDARRTTHGQRLISGGADRDRTGGLLVANQALSQLSYSPNPVVRPWSFAVRKEPTTNDARPTTDFWWAWVDLNYRPHAYQACALAT